MSNVIYITDTEGNLFPAEVRSYVPNTEMVVVYRDFATSQLFTVVFRWSKEKAIWTSVEGFESDFSLPEGEKVEVSIRIPKKPV